MFVHKLNVRYNVRINVTSNVSSNRNISWFAKAWWWGPSWPVVEERLGLHQLSDQFQRFRWGYMSFGFVWTWATQKFDSLDIGFFINMVIWYIQFSVRPIFVSAQRTFSLDVLSCKVLLTSGRFLVRTWTVGTVGVYQMCSTLPWSKGLCHLYNVVFKRKCSNPKENCQVQITIFGTAFWVLLL